MKPEIFNYFPALAGKLPHISIAELPTPVGPLRNIERALGCGNIFVKRDDLTAHPYGGNKVRKLEFILADALQKGARTVMTSGGAGSNHALATALYARKAGLDPVLMLFSQPSSESVRENLLMDLSTGARMIHDEDYESHRRHLEEVRRQLGDEELQEPYVVPFGGTSDAGVIGYVNAAFELKGQIDRGEVPCPERIYIALGSMGSAAGLVLGLAALKLPVKVVGVMVVPQSVAHMERFSSVFTGANALLTSFDPTFPACSYADSSFEIDASRLGQGYGIPTVEAVEAIRLFDTTEQIHLDGTYTGKTASAFISFARKNKVRGPLLLWNTKNGYPFDKDVLTQDYRKLPEEFHRYWSDVQHAGEHR